MKQKIPFISRLMPSGLAVVAIMLLTSFNEPQRLVNKIIRLTITGNGTYNLIINGVIAAAMPNPYHKMEQGQHPPYELEIPVGEYAIVIVRTSPDGALTSKIQNVVDDQLRGYAESSDRTTLLQVFSDGGIGASGME
jgi:hypothetical protein